MASQNHEDIPMHELHAREFSRTHFGGAKLRDAARELCAVQITDSPHDAKL